MANFQMEFGVAARPPTRLETAGVLTLSGAELHFLLPSPCREGLKKNLI